jgi:hypothetical protein
MTAAIRQLAYGVSPDAVDEYIKIGESTALASMKNFVQHIIDIYGKEYLRPPNPDELEIILKENELRGFPGCKGSIDGMHWLWKNCPQAWAGQFEGKEKDTSVVLEAVASKSLRIWHAFFGTPGALNDINVLQNSPLFDSFINGSTHFRSINIHLH